MTAHFCFMYYFMDWRLVFSHSSMCDWYWVRAELEEVVTHERNYSRVFVRVVRVDSFYWRWALAVEPLPGMASTPLPRMSFCIARYFLSSSL